MDKETLNSKDNSSSDHNSNLPTLFWPHFHSLFKLVQLILTPSPLFPPFYYARIAIELLIVIELVLTKKTHPVKLVVPVLPLLTFKMTVQLLTVNDNNKLIE